MASTWGRSIASFSDSIQELKRLPKDIAEELSDELETDTLQHFDAGQDPYGKAWKKRKHRYPWPILNRTGRLRGSYKFSARAGTITARNNASYSGYVHRIRLILPTGSKGLPKRWIQLFRAAVLKRFARTFK